MEPLTLILLGAGTLALMGSKPKSGDGPLPMYEGGIPTAIFDLPDVLPEKQGGNFSREFDDVFYHWGTYYSIPFCLLKAHAIRESSLKASAYRQEPNGKASYGLMQILWWPNSNRFKAWGYPDDAIQDGSILYDANVNVDIACRIILDNFEVHGNLRDAINSYNTGRNEKTRPAPHNYVNDVIRHYETLLGRKIV